MLSGLCELNVVFGSVPRWDLAFMAQMQREKSTRGGISLQLADFVPCKKGTTFFPCYVANRHQDKTAYALCQTRIHHVSRYDGHDLAKQAA